MINSAEKDISREKPISFYETISWLWKFWGKLKTSMVILVIMTPITMFFRSYTPIIIANIFAELLKGSPDMGYIHSQANYFLIFSIIHLVFYIYIQSLRGVVNYRLENDFRLSLFKYIIKLGQNFFQKFSSGDLATRLIDDVSEQKLAWFACSGIFRFYEAVIKTIQCLYFMFMINAMLTWVTIVPLILLVFIYISASEKTTEYSLRTQQAISKLNSFLISTIDGIRIVKSYNQEKNQEKYFAAVVRNQREKEIELVKASSLIELSYTRLSEIIIILIFLIGGWLVINHKLELQFLVAFNMYIFMLIWPMVDIGQLFIKGRGAGVSVKRVKELENFEPDIFNIETPLPLPLNKLKLEFKNLSYIFPNGNKVLNDISFSVGPGQCVAIAGAVGSGKSTFINFLPRIIDPHRGEVLLNGINLKEYDLGGLRKKIGFVPQNPSLFSTPSGIIFYSAGKIFPKNH
jgi:ABC-type multidrug transport system fused ATPase/permease subunit